MAITLDAISVAAAYGLLVVVFRFGLGSDLLGLYRVSQIEGWVPIFLFAMLFGLSMDYEVFFVTRMRESWDAFGDNRRVDRRRAHPHGPGRERGRFDHGRGTLGPRDRAGGGPAGAGCGAGARGHHRRDAVRGLLMPSLMAILGRWNWWLPTSVAVPCARQGLAAPKSGEAFGEPEVSPS